mmetsp:Transcript_31902/g.85154  ORF Transcript_31902/g.85154 Transcript_31902/m.85154 type:complete len:228 (-) Transcript_31902:282-965(-)
MVAVFSSLRSCSTRKLYSSFSVLSWYVARISSSCCSRFCFSVSRRIFIVWKSSVSLRCATSSFVCPASTRFWRSSFCFSICTRLVSKAFSQSLRHCSTRADRSCSKARSRFLSSASYSSCCRAVLVVMSSISLSRSTTPLRSALTYCSSLALSACWNSRSSSFLAAMMRPHASCWACISFCNSIGTWMSYKEFHFMAMAALRLALFSASNRSLWRLSMRSASSAARR